MNTTSVDIKDMLEADSGLGLKFGVDLFIGKEPDSPQRTVTIFDTHGMPPQLTFNAAERYEFPAFQIRVRSADYLDCAALISSIKDLLHGRANETWNETLYAVIYCSSGPAMLDWDHNGRVRFIVNFNCQRR